MKLVKKSLTTMMDMVNSTRLGRGRALEVGLDYCLRDVPDATHVEITVYKWVDDTPLESGAPPVNVIPETEDASYDYTEGGMW